MRGQKKILPAQTPVHISQPAGSNYWDMQTFELWVVVKGPTPIKVQQLPMVRISMALEMDVETFLNTDTTVFTAGLANALGIDSSTIRVTGERSHLCQLWH